MYLHYPSLVISTCFRFMYMYSLGVDIEPARFGSTELELAR
jgi:hypothetical protein